MNLKPSLGRKLNQDGLSPVHLALLNGHSQTGIELVKFDKDLIRVKGRERLTPLQYAAEKNDLVDILAEFLCACPESIGDLNFRGETALHIAVKNCNVRGFEVLMGWVRKTGNHWVKSIKDGRGNTILHTAVSTSQHHIVKSVVQGYGLHVNEENLEGATALDIAETLASGSARTTIKSILRGARASKSSSLANDCSLVDFLISRESWAETTFQTYLSMRKEIGKEMRDTMLVIAVLITTATFQSILSPPGGGSALSDSDSRFANGSHINPTIFTSTDNSSPFANGSHINATIFAAEYYSANFLNLGFYAMNTITFTCSIVIIHILLLPLKVFGPVHLSLLFMTMGYGTALLMIPSMFYLENLLALLAISIAYLLYVISIAFRILRNKNWPLFFMSHLQMKRYRMLYRVVMN